MNQDSSTAHNDEPQKLFGEFKEPTYEEWKEAAVALLKGKPFEKAMYTQTPEGITLQPIYTREALENLPHTDTMPGMAPYVRGTKMEGHLITPWIVSQEVYGEVPKTFNERVIDDLYRGLTGLNMTFDKPTLQGIDADHKEASEVGVRGVSISTLEDLSVAFHDLVLEVLPLQLNVGMNPIPLTALMGAYLKNHEKTFKDIKGVMGYDPLGYIAEYGHIQGAIDQSYERMADVLKHMKEQNASVRTILVEGHPYHNGGADAVQELAYCIATGAEYVRAMLDRGFAIDDVAMRMAFEFSLGSNFFMELSKIRAARMLWSKVIEAFGGNEDAQKMYIHGKTSSWTKSVYDPYVNMLRNASEAFSGAIAGVDSLEVVPFDEPIREADDFSRRVSRNVQAVLQEECQFVRPIDPAGGSWYIESLTHEIALKAWELFQEIEAADGMAKSLKSGQVASVVACKYDEKFKSMSKRKHVWVGVNKYANMTEKQMDKREKDHSKIKQLRSKEVQDYRKRKDLFEVEMHLANLGDALVESGHVNLDIAIKAVCHGATLGDIAEAVQYKEKRAFEAIKKQRGPELFEDLRDQTNRLAQEGKQPKVYLLNMGPIPQHKPRADFTTGFFEVGAFEVLQNNGHQTVREAVDACIDSGAHIGVICSTDATYPELVPEIAHILKVKQPRMVLGVAGRPTKELEELYREAGIDFFIYMGANCYDLLSKLQTEVAENV